MTGRQSTMDDRSEPMVVLRLTRRQYRGAMSGLAKLFRAGRGQGVVLVDDENAGLGALVAAEPEPGCEVSTTLDSRPSPAPPSTWLLVPETATRLGISEQAVHQAIERGSLAERPGRTRGPRLVDEASVAAYEAKQAARRAG